MAIDSISMNTPGLDRALAFRDSRLPGNLQSGVAYTPELADIEKVIRFTGAAAAVLTIPSDAVVDFPPGTVLSIARDGAGGVTIVAGAGVTLTRDAGTTAVIATQNSLASVRKTAPNTWFLFGALATA